MATVKSTPTWANAHALWSKGAMLVSLLMVAFAANGANDRDPNESIGKVIRTPVSHWFTGTVFSYDAKLGAAQCLADPENCRTAERDYEKLVVKCKVDDDNCVAGKWKNPNWHPERVAFSPDGKHLLVTVCRNADRQRCTLRRYWIDEARWDDLPGLDSQRYYGWGVYDGSGRQIAVASWKCIDMPRREDKRATIWKAPQPTGPECGVTDPALWLLDATGKQTRTLLAGQRTGQIVSQAGQYDSRPLPGVIVRSPIFSPDGKKLAYWRMQGALAREARTFSSWNVHELDLETGTERLIETRFWDFILGSPLYIDKGKRLAFSAHPFSSEPGEYGMVFVVDLAGELPVKRPTPYLDNRVDNSREHMALRGVTSDGSRALVATFGGAAAQMGSLYLYDLKGGSPFFATSGQEALRKVWQEAGSGIVNYDGALSGDGRRVALIDGREIILWSDHERKQLWLLDEQGRLRHVHLDW